MMKIILASSDTAGSNEIYERAVERNTFFIGSLVTGFFGFPLGLAQLLSIKVTSPVSHMVSSAAHSILQLFWECGYLERLSPGEEL
jgi:GDP-fucose transporter C1